MKPTVAVRPGGLVEVDGLRKSFGRRVVLDQLSFSAGAGDLVLVTGVSGAGKTTLLRLLHGQYRPDQGRLLVAGHVLHRRFGRGVQSLRRETGFIFQDSRLLPRLTAFENVATALQVARPDVPFGVIRRAAQEALDAVGLGEAAGHLPVQLSIGEQQRVAVARALAGRPRIILADEPTAALDEDCAGVVRGLLAAAAEAGSLVVLASHEHQGKATLVVDLPRRATLPRRPWRLRR